MHSSGGRPARLHSLIHGGEGGNLIRTLSSRSYGLGLCVACVWPCPPPAGLGDEAQASIVWAVLGARELNSTLTLRAVSLLVLGAPNEFIARKVEQIRSSNDHAVIAGGGAGSCGESSGERDTPVCRCRLPRRQPQGTLSQGPRVSSGCDSTRCDSEDPHSPHHQQPHQAQRLAEPRPLRGLLQ